MRARVWLVGCALGIVVSLVMSPLCFGAGFAIWEGSARGTALGQAVVGQADDPSAIFYNPAGITQLPGLQAMVGGTAILLGTDVKTPFGTQSSLSDWGFPPHAYITYQASDRIWLGLGVFTPFGLAVQFPRNWPGALNSYDAEVQSVTINPNIAFKLTDKLSFAVGFEAVYFDFDLKQLVGAGLPSPLNLLAYYHSLELKGNSWGYGFNLAAHYKPCEFVSMGIAYRSQVTQNGTPSTQLIVPGVTEFNTTAHTELTLPDSIALGVTFYPIKRLSWEVGTTWTHWSEYRQLQFTFEQPLPFPPPIGPVPMATSIKDWHDTWRFQTGVEYKLYPWLDLRAGYQFDPEPINFTYADYQLPSNDRHYFSFGPGFHWGKWTLDFSYTYILVESRNIPSSLSLGYIPMTSLENGHANLLGVSLGYKF